MAYFLKKTNNKKGCYLQIYFSFRDPETKQPRHKSIKPLGYVHELIEKGIDDPIAFFQEEVNQLNIEFRADKKNEKEKQISKETPIRHLGYFPLKAILSGLKIQKYIDSFQMNTKQDFSLYDAFSALCFARAVQPESKHKTVEEVIPTLMGDYDLSYDQILSACEMLGIHYEKITEIITTAVRQKYGLNTSNTYFDCTNYYFEIDREDLFRRKGPSKENRHDPIVGMGLLLDANCIPIGMRLYPGNQSEKPVLRETIDALKKQNNIVGKTVNTADKGLNCAQNIYEDVSHGDGYLFSKSVKQLPAIEKDWVLSDNDWKAALDRDGTIKYYYKSCVDEFEYSFKSDENGPIKFKVREKRLVTYNEKLARKQAEEIHKMERKAKSLCLSQAKKSEFGESAKYVTFTSVDGNKEETGQKPVVIMNTEALKRDLELVGLNMLITSEYKMRDTDIYNTYHNLWRIEETFRVMKSELDARPVYLQNIDKIKGHFLICYVAVVLVRLFQIIILKDKYGSHEIFEFIRNFNIVMENDKKAINTSRLSPLIEDMARIYRLPLKNYHLTIGEIKKVLECRIVPIP